MVMGSDEVDVETQVPVPVVPEFGVGSWAYVWSPRFDREVAVQVCCGPAAPLPLLPVVCCAKCGEAVGDDVASHRCAATRW